MRLWTLHPQYLDAQGLVALWREGLLAQAVLRGETRGYTRHPQLQRFAAERSSVGCLAEYLRVVQKEAAGRGYTFRASKISRQRWAGQLVVSRGQLEYEWQHLRKKLAVRSAAWLGDVAHIRRPRAHPLFRVVPGPVAGWERVEFAALDGRKRQHR
jgi:hypothetical protein